MEPNQMGAAGQPMPNQQIPTQPMPAAEAMPSMEQQMAAAMQEQVAEPALEPAPVMEAPKKDNKGMLIGMILAIVVAVAGIGFGAFSMISGAQNEDNYKKQIASLQSTNANLSAQLAEVEALNGDEALALLQAAAPYTISYANVYAKYNGEDDIVAYWVKYLPTNVPEGTTVANDIIFTLNDEGEWEFSLPGMTTLAPELANDYVLLDGGEVVIPAPVAPETPAEEENTEE